MSDDRYNGSGKYNNCFVCSPDNPVGLHMHNEPVDGKAHMEIVPNKNMEGLNGLMHGGFSLMIMDEVMHYAVEAYGINCVTLHSDCDFVSPAYLDHKLAAEAWVEKVEGKKYYTKGELKDGENVVVSTTGLYYEVDMKEFLPK